MHWDLQFAILGGIVISTLDHLHQGRSLFNPFYAGKITKLTKSFGKKLLCSIIGGIVAYIFVLLFMYDPNASIRSLAIVAFSLVPVVHDGRISKFVEAFDKKP
jgi:hypothetical protein